MKMFSFFNSQSQCRKIDKFPNLEYEEKRLISWMKKDYKTYRKRLNIVTQEHLDLITKNPNAKAIMRMLITIGELNEEHARKLLAVCTNDDVHEEPRLSLHCFHGF